MSTQAEYHFPASSQQAIVSGPSIWRLASDLNVEHLDYVPDIRLYCDHYMPGLDTLSSSSSIETAVLKRQRSPKLKERVSLKEGERVCNSCSTLKTTKWYKDHSDVGRHICKKCYNQRYKERLNTKLL
jgi:uncharacterized paraquat-inducible protein A